MMRGGASLLVLALLASPAPADQRRVNIDAVAACLAAEDDPQDCAPVIEHPCAHHRDDGLARGCLYRLRLRWEDVIAETVPGAGPDTRAAWDRRTDALCAIARFGDPASAPIRRNACRLSRTVLWWHRMHR